MSQLINEAKRMQFLAGFINENQLNEAEKDLNTYGKVLFDRLGKNGFKATFTKSSSDFDKLSQENRKSQDKLAAVQYDDMGSPGDGYIMIGVNNNTHDEIGKILDSIKSELPDGAKHFSNNMWSWQITGPGMAKKPQAESIEQTVNEALAKFRKNN